MWAKSPYYAHTPQLSRNPSVEVPSKAPSLASSRQASVDSQAHPQYAPMPGLAPPSSPPPFHEQMHVLQNLQAPPTVVVQPVSILKPRSSSLAKTSGAHVDFRPSSGPVIHPIKPSIVIDVTQLAAGLVPIPRKISHVESPPTLVREKIEEIDQRVRKISKTLDGLADDAAADGDGFQEEFCCNRGGDHEELKMIRVIAASRALARVKRQTTRELRFSFAESPSTSVEVSQQASRPRFHSVKIIEMEPKLTRKPTSYYEVYPLEAYDNRTERKKRKHIARHDPHYQASLREEFEIRKYTLIAIGICIFITITVGGFTIWQLVMDFTIDF
ncbi:hypothetical protein PRIPAC_76583 [Pristionchus pacificus]|uniref:Uncharacterized protein n=1 Tax=Pristionchus pacificus TaxID=54126 RepID=A0A2A6C7X7_PRIPA|nr:hypothetical protein PRIPAC_76583 [Pristionchus pacificus]|eukprot:PDM74131.1 hypothetical protein PRIPAC_41487 [Pristionchus pacificus]